MPQFLKMNLWRFRAVDYNSDYDDLEAQGQDEEDKYFDEESSQSGSCHRMSEDEDSLERFMTKLKPEPTPSQLAEEMQNLSHQEKWFGPSFNLYKMRLVFTEVASLLIYICWSQSFALFLVSIKLKTTINDWQQKSRWLGSF